MSKIYEFRQEPQGDGRIPAGCPGQIRVDDEGLAILISDDHYSGELSPEKAVELAVEILAKWPGIASEFLEREYPEL